MQRELWRVSWGWGRAFKKGKAWKREPFPSLGSRPCWRRCGGSSQMETTRLPRPESSRSNPPQRWWATDGQVPRGNGGTNAGMRARGNSVCLGSVARNKLLGCRQQQPTGRSPERVRVCRCEDGVCGVHIGRPQDGSHWAWTRATRSPWSHWGSITWCPHTPRTLFNCATEARNRAKMQLPEPGREASFFLQGASGAFYWQSLTLCSL